MKLKSFGGQKIVFGCVCVLFFAWQVSVWADGQGPQAAHQPLAVDGQLQLNAGDRCPVCGMFPAKRPKHAAGMMLGDGRSFYFCGNGCLLRTYHHPWRYLGVAPKEIQRMVVKSYFTGRPLDAGHAWWISGSDVIGPMGRALVALATEEEVKTFQARHGGDIVFQLHQLDAALWQRILPPKH